jgi:hypothetical protein
VAGYSGLPIRLFVVNGTTVSQVEPADWPGIPLDSHTQITIEIGTPIEEIPTYTWSSN